MHSPSLSSSSPQTWKCRIGWHKWDYLTTLIRDEDGEPEWALGTEVIAARCVRPGCRLYSEWGYVHEQRELIPPLRSE